MEKRFGWVRNDKAIAEYVATLPWASFSEAIGGVSDDDGNALLYKCVAALAPNQLRDGRLTARNQKQTNSCVGNGTASAGDMTTACEILIGGQPEKWVARQAADAMYAIGLQAVGQLRGDNGSNGSWAAKGITEIGTIHQLDYGDGNDLTEWSQDRTRKWSRSGLPSSLKQKAGEHKMGTTALVKTVEEAKTALQSGYGINCCSGQGFTSRRDSDGFCKASGSWAHSMAWIAYRGGKRPGFLIFNSWGDDAQSGPIWPEDMPWGSFWCDVDTAARMLRGGDSFAYSNYQGFRRQTLFDFLVDDTAPVPSRFSFLTEDPNQ